MPIPGTWDDPKKKVTDDPGNLTPVVITAISVNVTGDDTAVVTWTTSLASSSLVWYGVYPNRTAQVTAEMDTSPLVTSHTVTLTGLASGQVYLFQVQSRLGGGKDGMGNSVMDGYAFTANGVFVTPSGDILLEDGSGFVLQEDGSKITIEPGS